MVTASRNSVRVLSRPKTFGPTKQSFEIKNGSKKEVTVFLERLGSEHFRVPDSCQKLTLKPGSSARAQVEFRAPEKGCVITLSATYKAAIKVWVLDQDKGAKKELVDIFDVTGISPGFVSLDSLHCFDATGSTKQNKTGRRVR
jgi:hypothetical protein